MDINVSTTCAAEHIKVYNMILQGIISLVILFGSGILIICVVMKPNLRTNFTDLLVSMAGADLTAGVYMLFATVGGIVRSSLSNVPFCFLMHSFASLSLISSCVHVVLIGINRHMAAKYPVKHRKHARLYTYISICVGWKISVLFTALRCYWMVKSGFLEGDDCCHKFVVSGTAYITTLTFVLSVSVLLLLILHVDIIRLLVWKRNRPIAPAIRAGITQYTMTRLRNTIRISVMIFFSFTICWMPYLAVEWHIRLYGPSDTLLSTRYIVFIILFLNSSVNPIIYTIFNPDFKKAFWSVLCYLKRRRQHRLQQQQQQAAQIETIAHLPSNVRTINVRPL
ncbi:somatostatin receptor type 1-like [Tubulanus polymorphus]|uniref:somatostatin receptor type 1-like n=1 Tax=Tubulanus polymorphus TaxID=672921 RepID=UPI003DA388F0